MRRSQWLNQFLGRLFPRHEVFAHAIDYDDQRERDGHQRNHLVDVGFFVHRLPRLVLLCRMFGHKPIVDGTPARRTGSYVSQAFLWVRCARCGERGHPQGSLPPERWRIGQRYTGDWDVRTREEQDRLAAAWKRGDEVRPLLEDPGPIGRNIEGKIGGQLVIGGAYPGWELQFKVGNRFSEQTLAAHLKLGRLLALYLHTEGFGEWLVNLLNPWSETSKLVGVHFGDGRAGWWLWANRWQGHEKSIREPWWRRTEVSLRLLDKLLGPKRYAYTDIDVNDGEPVVRVVRMPEGDYLVRLKLQRCVLGRKRQWRKRKQSWCVDWEAVGDGIPFRTGNSWKGDDITGGGVDVSGPAVHKGTWPAEACAAIALKMTKDRTRYGFEPIALLPLVPAGGEPS